MPKKSGGKNCSPVKAEASSIRAPAAKRAVSEIDQIFADGKKRKPHKESEAVKMKNAKRKKKKNDIRVEKGDNDKPTIRVGKGAGFADEPFHPRKKTADGLKLYTEDELGIANQEAGGTRLCPFDCDCCF